MVLAGGEVPGIASFWPDTIVDSKFSRINENQAKSTKINENHPKSMKIHQNQ
jgi:hypothetical protein